MKLLDAPDENFAWAGPDGLSGATAVRVPGETPPSELTPHLARLAAVAVVFGGVRDGRGFSLASILRARGFTGELRAAGDLIADHAPMLARCGFDSVELPADAERAEWERAAVSFSAAYQSAADGVVPVFALRARQTARSAPRLRDVHTEAAELNARYRSAEPQEVMAAALERFDGRIAVLSSFGAEAAVGLHMAAVIRPSLPVLFLDTDRHFVPTLEYRDRLVEQLGLTDLRILTPKDAAARDARGDLWRTDADACCELRKVEPLQDVLPQFDALITGRKRFHGGERIRLPVFEVVSGQIRVNPLANWSTAEIDAYFLEHGLPRHPLTQGGYRSIGCWPCTQPSADDEDVRRGRWAGLDKRECGIHLPSRWAAQQEQRRAS
jgi:phosphoadenosine phosphosulfate reductase